MFEIIRNALAIIGLLNVFGILLVLGAMIYKGYEDRWEEKRRQGGYYIGTRNLGLEQQKFVEEAIKHHK